MSRTRISYEWYLGTPEGDRLSVLALGHRMSFRDKVKWSEEAERLARLNQQRSRKVLSKALKRWAK